MHDYYFCLADGAIQPVKARDLAVRGDSAPAIHIRIVQRQHHKA